MSTYVFQRSKNSTTISIQCTQSYTYLMFLWRMYFNHGYDWVWPLTLDFEGKYWLLSLQTVIKYSCFLLMTFKAGKGLSLKQKTESPCNPINLRLVQVFRQKQKLTTDYFFGKKGIYWWGIINGGSSFFTRLVEKWL